METQQRLLTQALNRAEHRLTEVYKILRSSLGPGSSVWVKGKKRGQIANREKYRRASIFPQSLAWSQANCVRFQLLLKCRKLSYKDLNFGRTRSRFSHNAEPDPRLLGCTCLHEIEASKGEVA